MIKFEAGKTYSTRRTGDSEMSVSVKIASRTAKTIKTAEGKSFRVTEYGGAECFWPEGKHSMAPIIRAIL